MARKKIVTDKLIQLLKKYPEAEHNDMFLIMKYWIEIDGVSQLDDDFLAKATSSETICRMKRRVLKEL